MNDLTIAEPIAADAIRSRILTIRGVQVILDRDLAELYGVTTGALNQAVKRNKNRFPERFMFQLTKEESENLKSQSVISSWGGSRSYPYAFTEQGIAMLSSVLRSETAILVSIRIMDVFVAMRKALASFSPMLMRLDIVERRQIIDQARNEERFKLILDAMQDKKFPPQKVFYDGQIYDAFEQMKKFVRMAKKELIVIDPYFADCVLPLIARKRQGVSVVVVKNSRNKLLHAVDVAKFNAQYANSLTVKTSDKFHDRFLIIDKSTLIHGMRRRNALRFGGQVAQRRQRRPQGPAALPSTTSARSALPSLPSTSPTSPISSQNCNPPCASSRRPSAHALNHPCPPHRPPQGVSPQNPHKISTPYTAAQRPVGIFIVRTVQEASGRCGRNQSSWDSTAGTTARRLGSARRHKVRGSWQT